MQTTADRYYNFKANYEMIQYHNARADVLPFSMSINAFIDWSVEEFMEHHKLRVPRHLLSSDDKFNYAGEVEHVHHHHHHQSHSVQTNGAPMFDEKDLTLPSDVNWFT